MRVQTKRKLKMPTALALLAASLAGARSGPTCPDGIIVGSTLDDAIVCERMDGTGALIYIGKGGDVQRRITKSYSAVYDRNTGGVKPYLGFNRSQWDSTSGPDILGNALLARSSKNKSDPTWTFVASAVPPMRYDGGFDNSDPAHGGRGAQSGSHTFVGSRASSVFAVFDMFGKSSSDLGTPDMSPFLGKYNRSTAVFKQKLDVEKTREGLFGGWLPIVSYRYTEVGGGAGCHTPRTPCPGHRDRTFDPCNPAQNQCDSPPAAPAGAATSPPNEIEFTAVPVEDASGSIELAVYFRVLRIDVASNAVLDAKYYQTFAYSASGGTPAKGQPAGSKTAQRFYSAIAAQQDYWEKTMVDEGAMVVDLPAASGTDGSMLANQSLHSIARDMISRIGAANNTGHGYFPQYGVSGVYAKASSQCPKSPLATENLLENTDGVLRPPEEGGFGATHERSLGTAACDLLCMLTSAILMTSLYSEDHGFEDTFQASFTMALEWGCFEYARGLLHNWLSYYLTPDVDDEGFRFTGISYRGRSKSAANENLLARRHYWVASNVIRKGERSNPSVSSRCRSLRLSVYADVRYIDDVIAF